MLGPDKHANIRLATDIEGRCRGFGYVELKEKAYVSFALETLRGVEVMGRKVRTDYSVKESKLVKFLDSGKGVDEINDGERSSDRGRSKLSRRPLRLQCSCITALPGLCRDVEISSGVVQA